MTSIIILPYILHRNDEVFPNPEEFVPERFLDEENKSKFLFGYIPFSAGPRNCIGNNYIFEHTTYYTYYNRPSFNRRSKSIV